ncbi:arginine/serine-rich coiled-coil protein 2 [Cocos nucifera]|uniref:Arginine/serine-rich coiled-coil protein 2 n=1 Tax=Cocos nucifera TaxID=13894 RepID=A0A8K0I2T8_COCNU|nr:arginine/serine-rich coiled-coil protein 2 [Cocos nucifera]
MDPALRAPSPDKSNVKASFRRPSNDAANRKYRRHSPLGDSDSDSSGGSPKRERSRSLVHSKEDHSKISDDQRRMDGGRELERGSNRYRSSREHDSNRHSDRHSFGSSHDFHRHDDYGRHRRHADEDERNYHRSSRSGRELRDETRSDRMRRDSVSDRYRDSWRDIDTHSREKYENVEHRIKRKERESDAQEHYRYGDKDYDKAVTGSRQINSSRDYGKSGERDRQKDRETRDDRRDHHKSPGNYKNDHSSLHDVRGCVKDSAPGRDSGSLRLKETQKSGNKEVDGQEDLMQRKHSNREGDKYKEKYKKEPEEGRQNEDRSLSSYWERDRKYEQHLDKSSNVRQNSSATRLKLGNSEGNAVDEKPSSSLKQVKEIDEKETSEHTSSITNQAGDGSDLNAAKVAAMKAAELVNKNLVGVGYLSTDQKKKLLWGNKKNSSSEETANRWDLNLFSDRERQEKFNKLMSLRLPSYLWPILGCEGHCDSRGQTRQQGRKPPSEETGARDGPGEAVYCWTSAERWPDSWSWPVMIPISIFACFECVYGKQFYAQPLGCAGIVWWLLLNICRLSSSLAVLNTNKRMMQLCLLVSFEFYHVKC